MAPTATKPVPPATQRADARRNRAKLLESARARFAEHGLDAQIDDIARGAGVGVGTVYRHFPTKEDLLRALAEARFEALGEAADEALVAADPWEGFVEFMTFSARTMAEDRALSEAMDEHPEICSAAANKVELLEKTGEVVARAQASGELRPDIVAWDIPSLVCGLGRAVRASGDSPRMDWERYLEIMIAGLRAPKAAGP